MIRKLLHKNVILNYGSWLILIFSLFCYFADPDNNTLNLILSSDSSVLAAFYRDMVVNHGSLQGWYYAATPTVFPDVTIYFALCKVFNLNFVSGFFTYGLVQVLMVASLSTYIFRKSVSERLKKYSWLVPLLFSTLFLESYYFSHDSLMGFFLLTYSYHTCPLVNCLITICIFLSSLSNGKKYVFFVVFSALSVFSDILYLSMLVGPLLFSVIFLFEKKQAKFLIFTILCIFAGSFLGMMGLNYVKDHEGFYHLAPPHKIMDFDNIIPSLDMFLLQMSNYMRIPGLRSFTMIFTFIAILVCFIIVFFRRKHFSRQNLFLFCFFACFSICVFASPIINGNYSGYDTIRYIISPFYISFIILAVFIAYLIDYKVQSEKVKTGLSFIFPAIFFMMISFKYSNDKFVDYFSFYPQKIREIDSVCVAHNFKNGIGCYWNGNFTNLLSKNGVHISTVFNTTNIYEMGSNINWYYNREYDFIIARDIDGESIKKRFIIKDTIKTPNHLILVVDKFIFPKGEYWPVPLKPKEVQDTSKTLPNSPL